MKLSKGQGISLFASIVIFGIFTVISFVAPILHGVVFLMAYLFEVLALATLCSALVMFFGKLTREDKFLSLPSVKIAWGYFILQTILSVFEMVLLPFTYFVVLAVNVVIALVFIFLMLASFAASQKIDDSEQKVLQKVIYIKQLKIQLDSIETENEELSKKVKQLSEDIRYSDPMSHSGLYDVESSLADVVSEIVDSVNDADKAIALCNQASKLLKSRNDQAKMLKGVKDVKAQETKRNGNSFLIAGIAVTLAIFLIALTICFIVIPQSKYKAAEEMVENKQYAQAIVAFTELGNYRDSEDKIEEINNLILEEKYLYACGLMEEENYVDAKIAFTELGEYKDSSNKVAEIDTILLDAVYAEAEALFVEGKYAEAHALYKKLDDYKDSKGRVEEINNRLAKGDSLYFAFYDTRSIHWQIIKNDGDKLLLVTNNPINDLPMNSDMKSVKYKDTTLYKWINEDFLSEFSEEQLARIIPTDGEKVFLLDEKTINSLKNDGINFKSNNDWWISTESEEGFMFVEANGDINTDGDLITRNHGVRPAIWISLK